MNFEEDMALEAYQNALRAVEAFRPNSDQTLAVEPLVAFQGVRASDPGDADIQARWLGLVAEVEKTKAELQRVRGD